jgi:hypothetical protein
MQDEKQQLDGGLVGRKMTAGPHGPAELGVQRLDGIRGVEDAADVARESIERDDFRSGATPTLRDGGIFLAPRPCLECIQGRSGGEIVLRPVDVLQRRGDGFAIFEGRKIQRIPQQIDDARLHRCLRKDGPNGFWKAFQAIDHGEQNVLGAAVFQLVQNA